MATESIRKRREQLEKKSLPRGLFRTRLNETKRENMPSLQSNKVSIRKDSNQSNSSQKETNRPKRNFIDTKSIKELGKGQPSTTRQALEEAFRKRKAKW